MSIKYILSIFAAALIGYTISPSYSQDAIFCNGFEDCPAADPALEARVAALEALLANVSRGIDPNTDQDTLTFTAMNVQIVSGSGTTNGTLNGKGNLIVGYNELRRNPEDCYEPVDCGNRRSGSHNLVGGSGNNYTSFGGMIVGIFNETSGPYATISGGALNNSSGLFSSISGGDFNIANAEGASISGGSRNNATVEYSWVGGGQSNTATGTRGASVSGGFSNTASGENASVSGGINNLASGIYASVSGGTANTASGEASSVSGGQGKTAAATNCIVGDDGVDC